MNPVQQEIPQLWKHLLPGYRVSSWPATLVWFILNFQNFSPSGLALCTALQRYKHSGVLFCLDLFKSTLSLHHFIWASRFGAQLYICCDWWRWPFRKICLKYTSSLYTVSEVAGGCLKYLGPFLWLFFEKLLLHFKIKIMLHKRAFFHLSFQWKCKKQKRRTQTTGPQQNIYSEKLSLDVSEPFKEHNKLVNFKAMNTVKLCDATGVQKQSYRCAWHHIHSKLCCCSVCPY